MRIYDKYKESGVKWIGEIPESWEVTKLKYVGKFINGYAFDSNDFCEQGVRVIKISNIQHMKMDWSDESYIDEKYYNTLPDFRVKKGDLVFALTRPIISTGIKVAIVESEEKLLINQRNAVLKPSKDVVNSWLYNLILTKGFIEAFDSQIDKSGQQPNISTDKISNIGIPFPSIEEQTSITNYLDSKTAEIKQTIADKEALIVLFEEEKKALINEAVTKGLNQNVKLKPSGVDWLGDIPEHWEVKRISTLAECITGFAFKSELFSFEDGIKLVRGDNVTEGFLRWGDKTRYWKSISDDLRFCELSEDDIVIGMDGSKVGKNFAFVEKKDLPLLLVQRVARLRASSKLIADYLYYNIYSSYFLLYIDLTKTDPAIPHITLKDIKDYKIMMPPLNELEDIVSYMKVALKDINDKINLVKKELELIKEYRQVLIFEAVTGKIKVTD